PSTQRPGTAQAPLRPRQTTVIPRPLRKSPALRSPGVLPWGHQLDQNQKQWISLVSIYNPRANAYPDINGFQTKEISHDRTQTLCKTRQCRSRLAESETSLLLR